MSLTTVNTASVGPYTGEGAEATGSSNNTKINNAFGQLEKFTISLALSPTSDDTTYAYGITPCACTVTGLKGVAEVVGASTGSVTLALSGSVTGSAGSGGIGDNLLTASTFDLTSLSSGSAVSLGLTDTSANLTLTENSLVLATVTANTLSTAFEGAYLFVLCEKNDAS